MSFLPEAAKERSIPVKDADPVIVLIRDVEALVDRIIGDSSWSEGQSTSRYRSSILRLESQFSGTDGEDQDLVAISISGVNLKDTIKEPY